jgi:hypothetical protein
MRKLFILATSLLVFGGDQTNQLQAQSEGLAVKIAEVRKANVALMKQYSWQSRTELTDNGKVADTRIETVSYGPDGKLQRTLLNDESSPLPRGFVRRRIAEREKEKVEKYLTGLRALLDQYTLPTEGKMLGFVADAKIQAPDANAVLQFTGTGVVVPGDTVTLSVQAATRQTLKLAITTSFEGDPVIVSASFRTLAGGLNHLEFGEVDVAAKQIKLQQHNYNYNQNN